MYIILHNILLNLVITLSMRYYFEYTNCYMNRFQKLQGLKKGWEFTSCSHNIFRSVNSYAKQLSSMLIQGHKKRGFPSSTCGIQDHSWDHLHYIHPEEEKPQRRVMWKVYMEQARKQCSLLQLTSLWPNPITGKVWSTVLARQLFPRYNFHSGKGNMNF